MIIVYTIYLYINFIYYLIPISPLIWPNSSSRLFPSLLGVFQFDTGRASCRHRGASIVISPGQGQTGLSCSLAA